MRPRVHPAALLGLATILKGSMPRLTPEQAVRNAEGIIKALHSIGMQVGPLSAFGPHDAPDGSYDPLAGFAQVMEEYEERRPWALPPELM